MFGNKLYFMRELLLSASTFRWIIILQTSSSLNPAFNLDLEMKDKNGGYRDFFWHSSVL